MEEETKGGCCCKGASVNGSVKGYFGTDSKSEGKVKVRKNKILAIA